MLGRESARDIIDDRVGDHARRFPDAAGAEVRFS
jgi:hypothetical protein